MLRVGRFNPLEDLKNAVGLFGDRDDEKYAFWLYLRVLVLGVGLLLGVLQVLAGGAAGGLQPLEGLLLGGVAHLGALLGRLLGSGGSLVLQLLHQEKRC